MTRLFCWFIELLPINALTRVLHRWKIENRNR